MSWLTDTSRALSAATKLVLHDREGLKGFNNTLPGFWHSFTAIVLIAPVYLFISSINWTPESTGTIAGYSVTRHLMALGLQWAIWPLVMVFATRWSGLGQHFTRYVIVYNWSNVLIITALSLPALLFRIGIIPVEAAAMLTGIIQLGTFYLEWYLARASLDTKGVIAAAVVLGNFVLSVGILRLTG